jgi:hypothetical protein
VTTLPGRVWLIFFDRALVISAVAQG